MTNYRVPITLNEISEAIGARLIGDGSISVTRIVDPFSATGKRDLALAMEKNFLDYLPESKAIAAVIKNEASAIGPQSGYLVVERSRYAMAKLIKLFTQAVAHSDGIHKSAVVDSTSKIARNVSLGPLTSVGPRAKIGARTILLDNVTIGADAVIGEDCLLHAGVRVGERVVLGNRVICQPNGVIGSDGFSFVTPDPGSVESAKSTGRVNEINLEIVRINSLGTVIIEDDVELGANVTIDRGTISATRIGKNSKLDNLVQVGHNVSIGENCMLCGQVGIAGSVSIGDRVVLAGQAGVADHISIGSDSVVGAQTGVGRNLKSKSVVFGSPAREKAKAFQEIAHLRRLGSVMDDIKALKNRIKALERQQSLATESEKRSQ